MLPHSSAQHNSPLALKAPDSEAASPLRRPIPSVAVHTSEHTQRVLHTTREIVSTLTRSSLFAASFHSFADVSERSLQAPLHYGSLRQYRVPSNFMAYFAFQRVDLWTNREGHCARSNRNEMMTCSCILAFKGISLQSVPHTWRREMTSILYT